MVYVRFLVFFLFIVSSCTSLNDNCIISFNIDRSDTPSPDIVEVKIQISDSYVFNKVIEGDFKSFYITGLRNRNLKYLFPIQEEGILDEKTFLLYIETLELYNKNSSIEIDNYFDSISVIVEFENSEKIFIKKCK